MLLSYPVRGEEPALVEALKMRALPEGSSKDTRDVGSPGWPRTPPRQVQPQGAMRGNEDEAMT